MCASCHIWARFGSALSGVCPLARSVLMRSFCSVRISTASFAEVEPLEAEETRLRLPFLSPSVRRSFDDRPSVPAASQSPSQPVSQPARRRSVLFALATGPERTTPAEASVTFAPHFGTLLPTALEPRRKTYAVKNTSQFAITASYAVSVSGSVEAALSRRAQLATYLAPCRFSCEQRTQKTALARSLLLLLLPRRRRTATQAAATDEATDGRTTVIRSPTFKAAAPPLPGDAADEEKCSSDNRTVELTILLTVLRTGGRGAAACQK